jgi:predicted DNA-binding transcriptional regulator AlpA
MAARRRLPPPQKRLLTLPETMALTGFSRTRTYEAAREGTLPGFVRLAGHRMLVRRRVLEAWLDGQDPPAARSAGGGGPFSGAPVPLRPAAVKPPGSRPRHPRRG